MGFLLTEARVLSNREDCECEEGRLAWRRICNGKCEHEQEHL